MSAPHTPTVEERLCEVESTLALLLLTTRALSSCDELCLDDNDKSAAWAKLDDLTIDALANTRAVKHALPFASSNLRAPDAEKRSAVPS
ncbi:MAG: hypothetical protein NT151_09495 [Acidobacteria bacterium]|nr:hypothetical protein [Acidobacteriota bacterium]